MTIESYVDANYRFIAAHQEINTRIAPRQQAMTLYATLVVSLLAALVALQPQQGAAALPVEWLVLGFPLASVSFAFLDYKAERAITNLRRFLAALEQLSDAHRTLPSYNTEPTWADEANKARRWHGYAAALLVAGGNAVGLGAALRLYPQHLAHHSPALIGAGLLAVLSFLALLLSPRWYYRPTAARA